MENYNSLHHLGAHGQNKRRVWKIEFPRKFLRTTLKCGSSFSFIILGVVSATNFSTPDALKGGFHFMFLFASALGRDGGRGPLRIDPGRRELPESGSRAPVTDPELGTLG